MSRYVSNQIKILDGNFLFCFLIIGVFKAFSFSDFFISDERFFSETEKLRDYALVNCVDSGILCHFFLTA